LETSGIVLSVNATDYHGSYTFPFIALSQTLPRTVLRTEVSAHQVFTTLIHFYKGSELESGWTKRRDRRNLRRSFWHSWHNVPNKLPNYKNVLREILDAHMHLKSTFCWQLINVKYKSTEHAALQDFSILHEMPQK